VKHNVFSYLFLLVSISFRVHVVLLSSLVLLLVQTREFSRTNSRIQIRSHRHRDSLCISNVVLWRYLMRVSAIFCQSQSIIISIVTLNSPVQNHKTDQRDFKVQAINSNAELTRGPRVLECTTERSLTDHPTYAQHPLTITSSAIKSRNH
jgi:hypothetical protein